jgi:hypothetical protein
VIQYVEAHMVDMGVAEYWVARSSRAMTLWVG